MADALRKIRMQLINEKTGEVLENVDVKTSAEAVSFADGETLATKGAAWSSHVADDDVHVTKAKRDALVSDISIVDKTGIITITKYDGTTSTIDTMLEKVVTNFDIGEDGESLDLTLEDGTVKNVSLSAFIDIYEAGDDTDTVSVDITDKKITASVKDGSITEAKLAEALATKINNKVDAEEGKGLSTEDFTTELKTKLQNIKGLDALEAATAEKIGGVLSGGDITVAESGAVTVNKSEVRMGTGTYADGTRVSLMLKIEE